MLRDVALRCIQLSLLTIAVAHVTLPIDVRASELRITSLATINPNGNAWINVYGMLTDCAVFQAFNGETTKLFATDGRSVNELDIGSFESPGPEPLYVHGPHGFGLRGSPPFRGELYFVARGVEGRTLYKTDGLSTTAVLAGVSGVFDYDVYLPPVASMSADFMYVTRTQGSDAGLYRTDGDVVSQVQPALPDSTSTHFFANLGSDAILFSMSENGSVFFRESAMSRSTISSNEMIKWPSPPTLFNGELYFSETVPSQQGLLRTDGSTIVEVPSAEAIHSVQSLTVAHDMLYFKARIASGYEQLFRTDSEQVDPFDLGNPDQHATRFIASVEEDLYLFEYAKRRIVRTDGQSLYEVSVDLRPDVGSFALRGLLGETLLLDLQVVDLGVPFSLTRGLFLLEGDSATFVDIGDNVGYAPSNVTVLGENVFFTAAGLNGAELFRLRDGEVTEFDINPNGHSWPEQLTIVDDLLVFTAAGSMGRGLYVLDGESLQFVDLVQTGDALPRILGTVGDAILVGTDAVSGSQLFALRRIVPEPTSWRAMLLGALMLIRARLTLAASRGAKSAHHPLVW